MELKILAKDAEGAALALACGQLGFACPRAKTASRNMYCDPRVDEHFVRVIVTVDYPDARHAAVGDIAFRWGFSSQAHFCRVIAAAYGAPPSVLRRNARA